MLFVLVVVLDVLVEGGPVTHGAGARLVGGVRRSAPSEFEAELSSGVAATMSAAPVGLPPPALVTGVCA